MKREVEVLQIVEVEIDETKFTPEFMVQFREYFYPFQTIEEHIAHLGQLFARGLGRDFIEGYGPAAEMGIKFKNIDQDETVLEPASPKGRER